MASFIRIQVTSMAPWLEKCPVSSYKHLYCYLEQNVVTEPWYEWQLQGVPVLGIYRTKFPLLIHTPARVDALKLAFQYIFLCLLGSLVRSMACFGWQFCRECLCLCKAVFSVCYLLSESSWILSLKKSLLLYLWVAAPFYHPANRPQSPLPITLQAMPSLQHTSALPAPSVCL